MSDKDMYTAPFATLLANIVVVALLIVASIGLLLVRRFLKKRAARTAIEKAEKLVQFFRGSSDEDARLAAINELGWINNETAQSVSSMPCSTEA